MPEELHASHGAFITAAILSTLAGLCLSLFLVRALRQRLGETKAFTIPLVVGHVIAYTLLLFSWKSDGINEGTIRAGLITLSVIPAFIVASAMGRHQTSVPEVPADKPPPDEKPQTFSEGMMKGIWAFIAIWVFYLFYLSLYGFILRITQTIFYS